MKPTSAPVSGTEVPGEMLPAANSGTFRIGDDLPVRRLGFGTMRLPGDGVWGEPRDRDEAIRVLRRAVELGINFIDTADSYGPEVSERLIAEALHPYQSDLVIASKGGLDRQGPNQWTMNGRPEHLRAACEGSLRRLRIERIDLYQLHRIDPAVPAEDQLGALRDLQARGKIRHVGLSAVTVAQIEHARTIVPVTTVQNSYSLVDRESEDVLDYCERSDIGFIPFFPLAAGNLTAPGGPIDRVAVRRGITTAQLALAWLLWRSPVMLPIPGTSRVQHLEENARVASLELDERELRDLGRAMTRPAIWRRLVDRFRERRRPRRETLPVS
jgi:aryl-alcohol dehydrogenase-like predicted oxidoreductase